MESCHITQKNILNSIPCGGRKQFLNSLHICQLGQLPMWIPAHVMSNKPIIALTIHICAKAAPHWTHTESVAKVISARRKKMQVPIHNLSIKKRHNTTVSCVIRNMKRILIWPALVLYKCRVCILIFTLKTDSLGHIMDTTSIWDWSIIIP